MKLAFFIGEYGTIEQRLWHQTQASNSSPFADEPRCSGYLVLRHLRYKGCKNMCKQKCMKAQTQ